MHQILKILIFEITARGNPHRWYDRIKSHFVSAQDDTFNVNLTKRQPSPPTSSPMTRLRTEKPASTIIRETIHTRRPHGNETANELRSMCFGRDSRVQHPDGRQVQPFRHQRDQPGKGHLKQQGNYFSRHLEHVLRQFLCRRANANLTLLRLY